MSGGNLQVISFSLWAKPIIYHDPAPFRFEDREDGTRYSEFRTACGLTLSRNHWRPLSGRPYYDTLEEYDRHPIFMPQRVGEQIGQICARCNRRRQP
jgi:hypothetical protein